MTNIDYEYFDEPSIDENYKCSICTKPLQHPVTTPCDHTYCQQCIRQWLSQNHSSCPTCRQALSSDDLTPITTRLVLNMLDKLLVKCSLCGTNRIERGNLNDHINKICPKRILSCAASDILCRWSGTRDEYDEHLSTCNYQQLRPVLGHLISTNNQLEQQIQALTTHLQILQTTVSNPTKHLITFDKLTDRENKADFGIIPEFYENLLWKNVWYMDERWVKITHTLSGWKNAYTNDHTCVAFNEKGNTMKIGSKQQFSLVAFEATAAWHDDLQINVLGRRMKQNLHSSTINLQFRYSQVFQFDWNNIDEVKFVPINGVRHPGMDYEEKYFALTWILLGK
ncbi:unnamed protein product [Adineta ricciae]|uniref:RING-type domain-containing protein n=1 Tax=Adineta ricciae TaxID=249248 RepID=A0A814PWA2_ADIRI|nr:unnamed protein product [Adineta ricciae]CAF1147100.1 unnamed protein product [Adineta ricciae]